MSVDIEFKLSSSRENKLPQGSTGTAAGGIPPSFDRDTRPPRPVAPMEAQLKTALQTAGWEDASPQGAEQQRGGVGEGEAGPAERITGQH